MRALDQLRRRRRTGLGLTPCQKYRRVAWRQDQGQESSGGGPGLRVHVAADHRPTPADWVIGELIARNRGPTPNQFLDEVWVNEGPLAAGLRPLTPSSSMVAEARFGLWTRPLKFDFLVTYYFLVTY